MATLNTAWSIVTSALDANQGAIDVIAGNTANAGTPGYVTRRPELEPADVVSLGQGTATAAGVALAGAFSQRDRVLNERINQQSQQSAATTARLSALQDLASNFDTALTASDSSANTGDIGQAITNFFNQLSTLAANPTDPSSRESVLSAAQALSGAFRHASNALTSQRASIDQSAASIPDQVNSLARNIAALNSRIAASSPAGDAGALEDQRQLDLTNLANLVGIHQIQTEANGLTITTSDGAVLVAGDTTNPISVAQVGGTTRFFVNGQDLTTGLASGGGQIGGLLTARDSDIPQALQQLDTLAFSVGTAVNSANRAGSDANGVPGGDIFQLPSTLAGAAGQMSVDLTDPAGIAAAAAGQGAGDGSNAGMMADLASANLASGATPVGFYASFVTQLGGLVSEVETDGTAQQASLTQLTSQQSALSSVNLNDQAAALQSFEQAYQAAAKVFSILNTVLAAAINLGTATTVT